MPPRQEVRLATAGDAPRLARLLADFEEEFDEPCPPVEVLERRYRELIATNDLVALLAGSPPVGFAQLRFRRWVYSEGTCAYLEELYVAPEQRGNGLGRALLEEAMETARDRGADHMELNTGEEDTAARGLYEKLGFTNREGTPDGPAMLYYEREI